MSFLMSTSRQETSRSHESCDINKETSESNEMSSHHRLSLSMGEIEHMNHLSEDIGALYLLDDYSDVTLIVSGQRFNGHKVILAARSQYFRALLFGGLKESSQQEIELQGATLPAFKMLLKYVYTGHMSLTDQKEETIIDILGLAHQYGFLDLELAISHYLREILCIRNVSLIFDAARLYQLEFLTKVCCEYMDKHATVIMQHESFLQLSASALNELIARDSFYAPEIDIFQAVSNWVKANPNVNPIPVLAQVRLSLIPITDLLNVVRLSDLVSPEMILDAIAAQTQTKDSELKYRGKLLIDENVATAMHGAEVLQGEMRSYLLNGDTGSYDMEHGYTRHAITGSSNQAILIKLGSQSIINHIRMLLWDRDYRSYSYYIEVSMEQKDWVRIIDHTEYFCRSWQFLYFEPRVVSYIRIVGTNNTVNKVFHVVSFEAYYKNHTEKLCKGFVVPTQNVATNELSASVIEGVSRSRSTLLNGDTMNYDWELGYTCHQLNTGCILVQLGQPYIINSMRLLLWDCDDRTYSYYIEVSGNNKNWDLVVDKTKEACRSWQTLTFQYKKPIVFIRIVGTRNTHNEVFHCVHFECPAQTITNKSPVQQQQKKLYLSQPTLTMPVPSERINDRDNGDNESENMLVL